MTLPFDLFVMTQGTSVNLKNEDDINLRFSRSPHGDNELSFDLCNWGNKLPDMRAMVALRDPTYGYFWSGLVDGPQIGWAGKPSVIRALGYQHTLDENPWDTNKVWEALITSHARVIQDSQSRATHINHGVPLPGGLATTILSEDTDDFLGKTPFDGFEFIKEQYDFLGTPLIWEIKQSPLGPTAPLPSSVFRFAALNPTYTVRLTDKDDFSPNFSQKVIFNKGLTIYGNKQSEVYLPTGASNLYKYFPAIRTKRINATNDISDTVDAINFARRMVQRNHTLRPINSTLTIHCDTPVEARWPAVPSTVVNVPHHLIYNNFVIQILNDLSNWGMYELYEYWITDTEWNSDGSLRLSLGDAIEYDQFALQQSYQVNRVSQAIDSGIVNQPLRDADRIQVFGPQTAGTSPSNIQEGIAMHYVDVLDALDVNKTDITKPTAVNRALVHPNLIPDYGVQVNFGREADSIGVKGFIKVVPCKVLTWEVCFTPAAGSDVVPTSTIAVELYAVYPPVVSTNILATCNVNGAQCASGTIAPTPASLAIFAQGGKIGVRVSAASSSTGAGFQVTVSGKRIYPDLGVTS